MTKPKPLLPTGYDHAVMARIIVLRGAGRRQADIARAVSRSQQSVSRYCAAASKAAKGRELELVAWAVEVTAAMQKVAG